MFKFSHRVNFGDLRSKSLHSKRKAFTLAEVLIVIAIIGVVAAMALPTLISGMTERSNSEIQANVAQKITKSMNLMRADGKLEQTYDSTDAFVDELSKYLKITTRCDASNIEKCWPSKTVTMSDGKTYEVKNAKTGKNLNLKDNTSNNVGMILADGTCIIMTYNPNAGIISDADTVTSSFASLPIGFGRYKNFAYTSNVTNSIDFVMDTNGSRGPNSETRDNKMHDIRSFKTARFSKTMDCTAEIDGIGCVLVLTSFDPIKPTDENYAELMAKYDPNFYSWMQKYNYSYNDYWGGAKKACDDIGMTLPDKTTLKSIYNASKNDTDSGLPTSGWFWSSSEGYSDYAYDVAFSSGYTGTSRKSYSNSKALCIGD